MCFAQRKAPGRNEAAGAFEVLRLLDLEGCIVTAVHCTAISTLPPRCSSGVRITCWPSRRPEQVVRCGRSALCAQRSPQRCRTARTRHSRSLPVAARVRPARYHFRRGPEFLAVVAIHASHRVAACSVPVRSLPSALLPALLIYSRQATASHRALLFFYLEPASLDTRCRLQRGSQPISHSRHARVPRYPPKLALNLVRSHLAATSLRRKSNAQGVTTPSSCACSFICDSPALEWEGSTPIARHRFVTPRRRAPAPFAAARSRT